MRWYDDGIKSRNNEEDRVMSVLRVVLANEVDDGEDLDAFCEKYMYANSLDFLTSDKERHAWNLNYIKKS